ncbi:MAG TPA: AI-2E family transporter [Cytophagaceae bacterium]
MINQSTGSNKLLHFNAVLIFLFLFFGVLYICRDLLIPISFAALTAMLLLPLVNKMESFRIPRFLAILLSMLLIIVIIAFLIFLITTQILGFADDIPEYKAALLNKLEILQKFIHEKTKVSPEKQLDFVEERASGLLESSGKYLKNVILQTTGTVADISLIVIFIFFFLYYKERFRIFILKITKTEKQRQTNQILSESTKVTSRYLSGVFIVIFILAVLNSVGLLIVGMDHAIFFGTLAAFLNIIPYIGVLIGAAIPVLLALIVGDGVGMAIAVAAVFSINQFLENNFLTPNIVGSQVKLNPLSTIIALLIGGSLWGVAGMIIFLPFLGVLKIVFDHVESLHPYGYLIGDDNENNGPTFIQKIKSKFKKKKKG